MSRVAVITGGAGGIGRAVAERLVEAGAQVVIADMHPRTGEVAQALGCAHVRVDVGDPEAVDELFRTVRDRHGRLDRLFLNAGVAAGWGPVVDLPHEEYRKVMRVNVDGVLFCLQSATPLLNESSPASVVVTASMAGLTGSPDPTYAAAKAAAIALVRSCAQHLSDAGVTINAVCPSFVDTPLVNASVRASGYPMLSSGDVADALLQAADSGETGQAWIAQAGHEPSPYRFRGVPGARAADGSVAELRVRGNRVVKTSPEDLADENN